MRSKKVKRILVVLAVIAGLGSGGFLPLPSVSPVRTASAETRIFPFNDLGMHCYDHGFAVLSFLPLFNVLRAQVILVGTIPKILTDADVNVYYRALADKTGSINTTSIGKTNFWSFAGNLFGAVNLPEDTGLLGARMPGPRNINRPFASFDPGMKWFGAVGIPITTYDDAGKKNSYPLMRVLAVDAVTQKAVGGPPVVLPVSDEMRCDSCHATGQIAAATAEPFWSTAPDLRVQATQNILRVHDRNEGTTLFQDKPVLCASCHYSKALDLQNAGPPLNGHRFMSHAIHGFHSLQIVETPGSPNACYRCHPGAVTRCLRGVMATAGIVCSDCHGTLVAVGDQTREPWVDEPKCQSCHTGDAVRHLGPNIRMRKAFGNNPSIATPRMAVNKRFAENRDPLNPNKALLFRNSKIHGGVACEACHGSTHAEWPATGPNDRLTPIALQGHDGTIIECTVCHGVQQPATMRGPHGMHNVNSSVWVNGHAPFVGTGAACQPCHGLQGQGTVLSKAAVARTFVFPAGPGGKTVRIRGKSPVSCGICHINPLRGA